MKTSAKLGRWLVLGAMALATSALAQKEQWLQYHSSAEGRGYRGLSLSTNPPPGVPLPRVRAKPWFAHWTTPMDPKGRWACFDRTRKSGPYDLVYFDSTGDGRLDNKTPVKAKRIDMYYAYFEPVRVLFKGEDGPVTYHLVFQFAKFDSSVREQMHLTVRSGGYYAGLVDLGGRKKRIELVDSDVNGTFNDREPNPDDCDHVVVEGDTAGERFLGKLLEVGNEFYRIEVARDGAFVKLQQADDLTFGRVSVPETISEFVAFGPNGHFVRKPVKGEFTLPAGRYRVYEWTITRKDSKGASWRLAGNDFPNTAQFDVGAGKPSALDIGEPVRAVMNLKESTNQVAFDLTFKGKLSETISFQRGGQNPPGPRLTLASLEGSYRVTNTFEFG
jgi:hypothetical protein